MNRNLILAGLLLPALASSSAIAAGSGVQESQAPAAARQEGPAPSRGREPPREVKKIPSKENGQGDTARAREGLTGRSREQHDTAREVIDNLK